MSRSSQQDKSYTNQITSLTTMWFPFKYSLLANLSQNLFNDFKQSLFCSTCTSHLQGKQLQLKLALQTLKSQFTG